MRGEHLTQHPHCARFEGSSPHARGALSTKGKAKTPIRLTPACAGSTCVLCPLLVLRWAHPRMRGEHYTTLLVNKADAGSSPHARGAPPGIRARGGPCRLIPACAGSTPTTSSMLRRTRAHPRMRGEHPGAGLVCLTAGGSSPHARGALRPHSEGFGASGLIPACAGSTLAQFFPSVTSPAHPRMRGEHSSTYSPLPLTSGSSPHARGAPAPRPAPFRGLGLIPACAGST